MQSLNGCRRLGWALVKDALPAKFLSAWVGCNYLQIAVATNYIFILQFPTKRACKKQVYTLSGLGLVLLAGVILVSRKRRNRG